MSSENNSNMLVSPSVCICGIALRMVTLEVKATTGNVYNLYVSITDTIDYLRRIIAKKTKLSKDRIVLLYKDRQLREGSLEENSVRDGAKLHLVPSVETGLLSQRPEQSVMQALESLNDSQITDFLSGKAPLNLTMRLGDHMMLIQLQLSTVSPVPPHHNLSTSHGSSTSRIASHHYSPHHHSHVRHNARNLSATGSGNSSSTPAAQQLRSATTQTSSSSLPAAQASSNDLNNNNLGGSSSTSQLRAVNDGGHQYAHSASENSLNHHSNTNSNSSRHHAKHHHRGSSSGRHHHHHHHNSGNSSHHYHPYFHPYHYHYQHDSNQSNCQQQQPPLSSSRAGLFHPPSASSALSHLYYSGPASSNSSSRRSNSSANSSLLSSSSSSSCTSDLPPRVCSHSAHEVEVENLAASEILSQRSVGGKMRGVGGVGLDTKALAEASRNLTQTLRQLSSDVLTNKTVTHHQPAVPASNVSGRLAAPAEKAVATPPSSAKSSVPPSLPPPSSTSESSTARLAPAMPVAQDLSTNSSSQQPRSAVPSSRSSAKANASKQRVAAVSDQSVYHGDCIGALPSSLNGAKNGGSTATASRSAASISVGAKKQQHAPHQGAIIESMQHHGKGVFSGTFSGTLNPALQDRHGRPKRDISTIIHILNDLLCATPHYSSQSSSTSQGANVAASAITQTGAPSPTPPKVDSEETMSAEDVATRSRVEQVRALLQQRAERRKARRLAKSLNSAPYSVPNKTNNSILSQSSTPASRENEKCESGDSRKTCLKDQEVSHQLMRSLLCSGTAAVTGEVMTAQTAGQQEAQEYESEQHSIEQVENTFSVADTSASSDSTDSVKEESKEVEPMDVNTIEASAEVKKQEHEQETIKLARESNHDEAQTQDEQQDKKQQQQASPETEQDAAKMLSLNSGAVVA